MNDPKERPTGEPEEVIDVRSEEELIDDTASEFFFGKKRKDLIPDDLKVDGQEPVHGSPMDSPSVQFFGESLEDFIEKAEEEVAEDLDDSEPADQ